MNPNTKSKLRRLKREIEMLNDWIDSTKESIKFNPYKADLPGSQKMLAELQEDLANAKSELASVKEAKDKRKLTVRDMLPNKFQAAV